MSKAEEDALDFGRHSRGGAYQLGLLVARSSYKGRPTDAANAAEVDKGKMSSSEFATLAGVSQATVIRYLAAWNRAAELELVPASTELSPDSEVSLDSEKLPAWPTLLNRAPDDEDEAPEPATAPVKRGTVPEGPWEKAMKAANRASKEFMTAIEHTRKIQPSDDAADRNLLDTRKNDLVARLDQLEKLRSELLKQLDDLDRKLNGTLF